MTVTRRAVLGAGLAGLAGVVGCDSPQQQNHSRSSSSPTPQASGAVDRANTAAPPVPAKTTAKPPATPTSHHGPAIEVVSGAGRRPEVALTFHGAGDEALARQIVNILHQHGATATVLAVGTWLAGASSLAKSMLAAGHELGNHTWSHPTLIELDAAAARAEILRCREVLIKLTGSPGTYFRQSGSQHSSSLIRTLAGEAGYPVCLSYGLDSLDWTDPGPSAIRANVAAAKAGAIVSMHLGHQGTATALPAILDDLRLRGLRAVTATALLA